MKRVEIVAEARKFTAVRVPWRKMGRTMMGVDCYGFILLVAMAFNLQGEDWMRFIDYPNGDECMRAGQRMAKQVHPPFKDGQIIVFHGGAGRPVHVGITATDEYGRRTVIHAGGRRVAEEPLQGPLFKRYRALFEFPGVED